MCIRLFRTRYIHCRKWSCIGKLWQRDNLLFYNMLAWLIKRCFNIFRNCKLSLFFIECLTQIPTMILFFSDGFHGWLMTSRNLSSPLKLMKIRVSWGSIYFAYYCWNHLFIFLIGIPLKCQIIINLFFSRFYL